MLAKLESPARDTSDGTEKSGPATTGEVGRLKRSVTMEAWLWGYGVRKT
jgi:hypothetical protein